MRSKPRSRLNDRLWIGVALIFYSFVAIGIAEGGLGVILPSILETYSLTPATVTFLFISQVSGYAIAATASSFLTHRFGLAKTILLGLLLLTSALSLYASTTQWIVMIATGSLLGFGIGLIDAGGNTFIAHEQQNANLMGLLHAFYGIGALSGPAIATAFLTFGVHWRQIYAVIAGIVSVSIVGMLWAVLHQYSPLQQRFTGETTARSNFAAALRNPIVIVSALLLLIYVGTEVSIGNWAYTVQHVGRGISTQIAGYSVSGYWVGLTIGRLSFGQLMNRLGANRTIVFSLLLLIVGLLIWWQIPSAWLILPVLGFGLAIIFPAMIWLTPQRVDRAMVPTAIGLLASMGSVGAATIPTGVGWVANQAGIGIIPALMLPLAIVMLGLHSWLMSRLARR
ncbi:MFS transporter [Leptolyngbya sp. FACHB-17]|uniref:MFS transporter n=1 Tax=unclassified Leptolyngbya TaxID=2650499 RepID=UPI001680B914|nr:MFS transporter [Leptolyngbya sp. FACHB-17]